MRILDFVRSILPRLRKDQILEDLRITAGELEKSVVPAFDDAAKYFKSEKIKDKEATDAAAVFYRNYKGSRINKHVVLELQEKMDNVVKNLAFVADQNDDLLERDVLKDGLTAKKAILVRSAEQLSFIARFSMDFLNYIYMCETKASDGAVHDLVPAQLTALKNNIPNFAAIFGLFAQEPTKFQAAFDSMPDVIVNDKTYASLAAVYADDKLDPLQVLLVQGFQGNPIYHLRLIVAEWQADRYKLMKDKKRMLELRLLNLKMLNEKNPDPKVEQEITYIQNRVETMEYKMKKMEDSVS